MAYLRRELRSDLAEPWLMHLYIEMVTAPPWGDRLWHRLELADARWPF